MMKKNSVLLALALSLCAAAGARADDLRAEGGPKEAEGGPGALGQLRTMAPETPGVDAHSPKPVSVSENPGDFHKAVESLKGLYEKAEKPTLEDLKGWHHGHCFYEAEGFTADEVLAVTTRKAEAGAGASETLDFAVVSAVYPLDDKGRLRPADVEAIVESLSIGRDGDDAFMKEDGLVLTRPFRKVKKSGQSLVARGDDPRGAVLCLYDKDVTPAGSGNK